MCAQYIIKANAEVLIRRLGLALPQESVALEWNERIFPHSVAPVVVQGKSAPRVLYPMRYSLIPRWSKTPKVKFATYNARMEVLTDKPTWRESFYHRRCLVPLHSFVEPIYDGEWGGNMVQFTEQQGQVMVAAGLWDHWQNPQGGESFFSFAIVTSPASAFVENIGHDRMPVFLREEAWELWLDRKLEERDEILALLEHRSEFAMTVTQDRPLRASAGQAAKK